MSVFKPYPESAPKLAGKVGILSERACADRHKGNASVKSTSVQIRDEIAKTPRAAWLTRLWKPSVLRALLINRSNP